MKYVCQKKSIPHGREHVQLEPDHGTPSPTNKLHEACSLICAQTPHIYHARSCLLRAVGLSQKKTCEQRPTQQTPAATPRGPSRNANPHACRVFRKPRKMQSICMEAKEINTRNEPPVIFVITRKIIARKLAKTA